MTRCAIPHISRGDNTIYLLFPLLSSSLPIPRLVRAILDHPLCPPPRKTSVSDLLATPSQSPPMPRPHGHVCSVWSGEKDTRLD